jgi:hypothetical protein
MAYAAREIPTTTRRLATNVYRMAWELRCIGTILDYYLYYYEHSRIPKIAVLSRVSGWIAKSAWI